MSWLRPFATFVLVLATVVPHFSVASTILKCGHQCDCWSETQEGQLLKEYRIVCNGTGSETVKLTTDVFPPENGTSDINQVYVRVQNASKVAVTHHFINHWKRYPSCSLDVWHVGHLELPKLDHPTEISRKWLHVFAGIGIENTTLSEIPDYLFSGKQRAGLRLVKTTVGLIQPDVFSKIDKLKYLEIAKSNIGIFRGSTASGQLSLERINAVPINVHDSFIGQVESAALNVKSEAKQQIIFDKVTIGRLNTASITISNMNLEFNNSRVGDMQPKALQSHDHGSIRVKNSYLIAQPGAMTHLKCSFSDHHITTNVIVVVPYIDPETSTQFNSDLTNSRIPHHQDSFSQKLGSSLHSSCVTHNLPSQVSDNNCSEEKKTPKIIYIGLYSFIGISIAAVIVIAILICVLMNARTKRQKSSMNLPTMVMSQINDPLYEEVSTFLMPSPSPPVPPPVLPLPREKGACSLDQNSGTFYGNGCQSNADSASRIENDYTLMR